MEKQEKSLLSEQYRVAIQSFCNYAVDTFCNLYHVFFASRPSQLVKYSAEGFEWSEWSLEYLLA